MSRNAPFAIVLATLAVAACSGFGSDDAPAPAAIPDAGGPAAESGLDPVGGEAARGITLTAGETGKPVFVMQSKKLTVPVKLERRSASVGPVVITVTKLPLDATADPLTIPANVNDGTLTLHAAATTPQGLTSIDLTAVEQASNGASTIAKLDTFVRGLPGSLDTTFGTGGIINEVFGNSTSVATDARVIKDGTIVVSGRRTNTLALARFTPAGVLDLTFAGGLGRSSIASAQGTLYFDVYDGKTPADGFISAVGAGTTSAPVFRAKLDGLLDTAFGGTGQVASALGLGNCNGVQTFALPDGTELVLTQHLGTTKAGVVSRWKPDGTLDSTYGVGGVCQLTASGTASEIVGVRRMFLKPDGSVRVVLNLANGNGAVKGCTASGALDTTLGLAPDHLGSVGAATVDAALYFDGGLVTLTQTAWSRVNAAFVGDSGLGSVLLTPLTSATALLTQADGGILVGGEGGGSSTDFTLVRWKATAVRDPDFGTAGVAFIPISAIGATITTMVAQPDGRILLVGHSDDHFDGLIARVWP